MGQLPWHAPPRGQPRTRTERLCCAAAPLGGRTQLWVACALGRSAARPRRTAGCLNRASRLRRHSVWCSGTAQSNANPCRLTMKTRLKQALRRSETGSVMSGLLPYTFTVLRYVHDVVTGEFLNVSVLLSCPEADFIGERTRNTHGRLSAVFPDLDRDGFRTTVASLRRAVSTLRKERKSGVLSRRPADASTLSRQILPFDDTTLQWSPPGGGLTDDPEATLN